MPEKKNFTSIAVSTFFGAVGALVALLVVVLIGYKFLDLSFLQDASCGEGSGTIYCFFDKDEKWDSGTYLSIITGFYTTIITFLIALLGAVAAFAYFSIKGSSHQRVDDAMEKEVEKQLEGRVREYFNTDKADENIRRKLKEVGDEEFGKIFTRLDEIKDRLEVVEYDFGVDEKLVEKKSGQDDEKETE